MATSQAEPPHFPGPLLDRPHEPNRSRLLPDLNQFLLSHPDLRSAFPDLCRRIKGVLPHEHAGIAIYEAGSGHLRLFIQVAPPGGVTLPSGFILPLDGTPAGEAYRLQRPIVVDDLRSPQFLCETTRELLLLGDSSGCWVPLRTPASIIGVFWISGAKPGMYRSEDAFFLNEAAAYIALTLAKQIDSQRIQELEQRLDEHSQQGNLWLHEIANASGIGIVLWEGGGRFSQPNDAFLRLIGRTREELEQIRQCSELAPPEFRPLAAEAEKRLREFGFCPPFEQELLRPDGTRVPVLISAGQLEKRCPPWIAFVVGLQGRRHISAVPSRGGKARVPPSRRLAGNTSNDIAAASPVMTKVLRDLEKVAPTDATILLLGETGTGKDVLARAICRISPRRDHPFIKVNCAAIPSGLLEDELFGHEKGAFAGAQARKIGRLELAHRGTLFLDEVGDIPLELQPKLLRVLQERAFERLGGTQTIKVDVRFIVATNRDLKQMTASNQFRRDLFYRLNVFPVRVPPLRERPESIPVLANLFTQKLAQRMNRPRLTIPRETMAALERWIWPGNIRELENLIERAVILSPGPALRVNLDDLRVVQPTTSSPPQTLFDVEREHIRHVLHDTNGVVGGKHGAASRLGLKRTTLQYKMKKLEISRY